MSDNIARTFLRSLEVFRPAFTQATFARWTLVLSAWILCHERFAITECLVVSSAAGVFEHSAFHRVFSRRRWDLDALARLWLLAVLPRVHASQARLQFAIDDTLGTHKGPNVFGLGTHLDPVRSSRKTKVFSFGHVWVTCALVVHVPFAQRPFALPVLFRLYRSKKECAAHDAPYQTKTALASELIALLLQWLPQGKEFDLLLDGGYANRTVMRPLPPHVRVFGALDLRASLRDPAGRTLRNGRHSAIGDELPKLKDWAADDTPWETVSADVYGGARTMSVKHREALWWHVLGARPIRVVILRCTTGTMSLRAFLCTDPRCEVPQVLTSYARRWSIELFFFEGKQLLGLCASRAWSEGAVRRLTPCVGLLYGVLVVWFWEQFERGLHAVLPPRPWYGHKSHVCFADILRTARAALGSRPLVEQINEFAPLRRAHRRTAERHNASRFTA